MERPRPTPRFCHRSRVPLIPEKGSILGYDPLLLDQKTTPGNNTAAIKIFIAYHLEFGLMISLGIVIGNLLRLDMGVQFLLAILETDGQIGGTLGTPEKIQIITETLMLIEFRHRAKEPVLPFKSNGRVLHGGRCL